MGSRARVLTTAANVVDDMITFARQASHVCDITFVSIAICIWYGSFRLGFASQGRLEEALDVLRTGIRSKPGPISSGRCDEDI